MTQLVVDECIKIEMKIKLLCEHKKPSAVLLLLMVAWSFEVWAKFGPSSGQVSVIMLQAPGDNQTITTHNYPRP